VKRRRVKITGIGPVTPAGIGREAFSKGIFESVSRIRDFNELGAEFGHFVAAYIDNFNVRDYGINSTALKGAARHTLFATAGAALALADAGLSVDEANRLNPVFVAGSAVMDLEGICRTVDSVALHGPKGALARTIYTANAASIPATAAMALGLRTRTVTIQSSCCAGLDAVGRAAAIIAEGTADLVVCGGTDAPLSRCPLLELRAAGYTPATVERADEICRPFDLWRTTGVVSEGACMFTLEPESSPRAGIAFISGYASANDEAHMLCSGMESAMKNALADAGCRIAQIDAISAWGPGHRYVDLAEAEMLLRAFGERLQGIPTYSIKGAIGSAFGAAPAIQLATAALAQQANIIPPTVNWRFPDPGCPLNLSSRLRDIVHTRSLINSHGIAGLNSSMIIEKC